MFKWAAEEELISGEKYRDLREVASLVKGKTSAPETEKILPVPEDMLLVTIPYLPETVQAMVRFEWLTGCRPDEVCSLCPVDLDMSNPKCWVYQPDKHKTEHPGHSRFILIGPQAQAVLRPFLGTKVDANCFSPAESEAKRNAERITPGKKPRKAKKKRSRPPRINTRSGLTVEQSTEPVTRPSPHPSPCANGKGKAGLSGKPDSLTNKKNRWPSGSRNIDDIPTNSATIALPNCESMAWTLPKPYSATAR